MDNFDTYDTFFVEFADGTHYSETGLLGDVAANAFCVADDVHISNMNYDIEWSGRLGNTPDLDNWIDEKVASFMRNC